ncbi:hypothetical protein AV530_009948 [Patagioenas fasciata monilis]|uniref:Uncharacterized protein n=1 Tax=Patagioenas fasciata monilis TaxID=372326 RepID=A0A1V4KCB2_PATFA|nr:hypothetical protein AV530_009948 [Patagioenas fasciata monilis]
MRNFALERTLCWSPVSSFYLTVAGCSCIYLHPPGNKRDLQNMVWFPCFLWRGKEYPSPGNPRDTCMDKLP